MIIIRLSL